MPPTGATFFFVLWHGVTDSRDFFLRSLLSGRRSPAVANVAHNKRLSVLETPQLFFAWTVFTLLGLYRACERTRA